MAEGNFVTFDKPKLERLKKVYQKAVEDKKESFIFEGNEYVVNFTKYVIEYLESQFNSPTK
ncbi:MAG TPA: hypothetical protein VEA58_09385 [Anaerovoracaceae bacterium]|nr:hypothetical protein [Anaerovoracaceae bacterium]